MFAVFEQPDLKATFTFTVTAPDALGGRVATPPPPSRTEPATARRPGRSSRPRASPPTSPRSIAGPVRVGAQRAHEPRRPRHPARRLRPQEPVPSTWTPTTSSTRPARASRSTRRSSATPYPFDKYDQLFVPEFNAGAMENAGAVTFTETYVFRSQGDGRHQGAPRRHDPARARPHVVRRPRDHEVVERPVAERVVRRVRLHASPRPRPPSGPRPGRRSTPWRRPGRTGRTSCLDAPDRRRRSTTSRTSRSTSTASPTPRARSVLKQLVAWVGMDEFFAGVARVLQEARATATPSCATCSSSSRPPAAAT